MTVGATTIAALGAALAMGCSDAATTTTSPPQLIEIDMDKVQPLGTKVLIDRTTDGSLEFSSPRRFPRV